MNNSHFYIRLVRHLYIYRHNSISILKSRTYTLGKSIKTIIKEPILFVKKGAVMILRDPKKLFDIVTGRRAIQSNKQLMDDLTDEYSIWINQVEQPNLDLEKQKQSINKFKAQPLISLITPVFNPPVEAHTKLVESVLNQTYSNFELLLFNFGDNPEVEDLLNDLATKDSRVKVKHGLPNKGISENSNLCLEYAKGDFLGLLDHDDALMPNALFECVKEINASAPDFIYTDKDKISEDDVRSEPFFKPDWSPEMALGGNYMTHFNLMRTNLVKKLGGWNPETDGAQDWDLFLRVIEKTNKIAHVPVIAYHWRMIQGSTSTQISVKPYAIQAQRLAVNNHLKRLGISAEALHDEHGQLYIEWPLMRSEATYIIHSLYCEPVNLKKLVKRIKEDPCFSSKSRIIVIFYEHDFKAKKLDDDLLEDLEIEIYKCEPGELVKTIINKIKPAGKTIFLADSIKDITASVSTKSWPSQLLGWLDKPGVSMAGAGVYAENGQVVDAGSFYDPSSRSFRKYYFATGFRSGYNGYLQWIRNHILVSEQCFGFDGQFLLKNRDKFNGIRDDELAKMLALIVFSSGRRAVYDPKVSATTNAPFDISLPFSNTTKAYIKSKCSKLKSGDPYYNLNLDNNYCDPKPRHNTYTEPSSSDYRVAATDYPIF